MTALAYTTGTAIATRMGTTTDSILDAVGLAVNDFIEDYIGAPIGPAGTTLRTYDGTGRDYLWIPGGINSVTLLRIKDTTGGTWSTIGSTYYALRPHDHERPSGWPAFEIRLLTELGPTYSTFTRGYDTVEVTPGGTSSTGWGWPAIPTDLAQLAIVLGTQVWQARESGETQEIGTPDFSQGIVRFLDPDYRGMLDRYRLAVKRWDGL
jgi:hypothetical protein